MLILLVQDKSLSNTKVGELLVLLTSKMANASVNIVSREEALEVVLDVSEVVLFITQDDALGTCLSDSMSFEVLVWKTPPDLLVKLDMFSQLQRRTLQYPLSLKSWKLKEVLYNSDNSIIYRAINHRGQDAAIKRYKFLPRSLSKKTIQDLLLRIKKQCSQNTKGLVNIYEGGISDNAFYIVMEYLQNGTLRQTLDGCGNHLPLIHALEWFQEIVLALECVHKAGLIHRDLKIDNILMRGDGSLALTDYGVSKRILLDAGFIQERQLHCSPHYVSPEQISGDACTKASDIYSLGVIFHELLTGKKPYSASRAHDLMIHHIMAPVPTLPLELCQFQPMLDRMMAKNPEDRYSTALEIIEGLPVAA